jgi:Zn-dependent protease
VLRSPAFLDALTPDRIAHFVTWYVVLLFSLSVHETAHAWMALRMGDRTAADAGRITLNPLAHIDPVGTILMPVLQLLSSGMPLLAWAKPTPVQARNFRPGMFRRGQILVAGAGPVSNFVLALFFTIVFVVLRKSGMALPPDHAIVKILVAGVTMNVILGVFNLVPLPPLDGSWIASWGLPRSLAAQYDKIMEPYGQWILLIAFVTGALTYITQPLTHGILMMLSWFIQP